MVKNPLSLSLFNFYTYATNTRLFTLSNPIFQGCIHKGKVTAIMGPSGSGKSTLLHLFNNMLPDAEVSGEIYVSGSVPETSLHKYRHFIGEEEGSCMKRKKETLRKRYRERERESVCVCVCVCVFVCVSCVSCVFVCVVMCVCVCVCEVM